METQVVTVTIIAADFIDFGYPDETWSEALLWVIPNQWTEREWECGGN